MQLKMTAEPIESTATVSHAPLRQSRHVSMIEVHSATQPEGESNTMAIPVYDPPSPDRPRHSRHARLIMTSEAKLQEWLEAQSALATTASLGQNPITTEAEGTSSQFRSFLFTHFPIAPASQVMPVATRSLILQKPPFPSRGSSKSRPCQLAVHPHLHPSFILSALCPKGLD